MDMRKADLECPLMEHCVQSEKGAVMFMIDDCQELHLNVIPTEDGPSHVRFEARLITNEEH